MAHYKTYRIEVSLVDDDMIQLELESGSVRLKPFGESMSPEALLDEALNLIRSHDARTLDTYAVVPGNEKYLFFITAVPVGADAERLAAALEAKHSENELNRARNKALRPGM